MEDQYFTPPPVPEQKAERMEEIPPLKPNNWLWQSIVVTLCCCVPFGIVGIVYAAKVDVLYFNGRYQDAEAAARSARTWVLVAFVIGIVALIGWISLLSTGNMSGYMEKIIENSASGYNF
ncbi:MAG: CD225/dispanin family protein [Porphyromonadaceae bacterium]|nr:CD225/dispanin family protein [Porphyromonadaceae bacterium]